MSDRFKAKVGRPTKKANDPSKVLGVHTTGKREDLELIEKKIGNVPEVLRNYIKELATNIRQKAAESKE